MFLMKHKFCKLKFVVPSGHFVGRSENGLFVFRSVGTFRNNAIKYIGGILLDITNIHPSKLRRCIPGIFSELFTKMTLIRIAKFIRNFRK